MPVRIFYVEGNKLIGELESETNKWQKSLVEQVGDEHSERVQDRKHRPE